MNKISFWAKGRNLGLAAWATVAVALCGPAVAQVETVDPGTAIDGDLAEPQLPPVEEAPVAVPVGGETLGTPADRAAAAPIPGETAAAAPAAGAATYRKDDLIGAAEGVFGKGAQGTARIIEDLLKKQGEPNGYIVGREASGALGLGLRYGSGTLFHKIEGQRPVYWSGPSIGFDAGGNAGNSFVLVYNLHDTEQLFSRFPAGEGQAYMIGGMTASYLRKGDVVLIPIRMGVGVRLGINAGYVKFSKKQKWLPF